MVKTDLTFSAKRSLPVKTIADVRDVGYGTQALRNLKGLCHGFLASL